MLSPRRFLERCRTLLDDGFRFTPALGMTIARGFADLGFEEFSVLNTGRIVSLLTGDRSELPSDYREHFFLVPTCDQLVALITDSGSDIVECRYVEQRAWQIIMRAEKGVSEIVAGGNDLQSALLEAFIVARRGRDASCEE